MSLPPSARSTRAMLGQSVLMSKVVEMKGLEDDSVEVVQLAKTAFNNLKVCYTPIVIVYTGVYKAMLFRPVSLIRIGGLYDSRWVLWV